MVISVRGELHFFRRFEFNSDLVAVPLGEAQPEMMGEGAVAETAARSLTQLQRSLDLWDDSYPHLPLETLRVHAGRLTDAVVGRIAPEAGVDTRPLSLSAVFQAPAGQAAAPWKDPAYLPLLGALLRPAPTP
jgi:MSHA biogenesis protein MshI